MALQRMALFVDKILVLQYIYKILFSEDIVDTLWNSAKGSVKF